MRDEIAAQRAALEDALAAHDETFVELQESRDELLRTRQILEEVQRVARLGYWVLDLEAWQFEWSEEVFQIWGRDPAAGAPSYRDYLDTIPPSEHAMLRRAGELAVETGELFEVEHRVLRPGGETRWVRLHGRVLGDGDRMIGAVQDITERRHLEAQLRQSQKMEAVGRLAGGVAHDFNNVLTAIVSFTEFAMEGIEPTSPPFADLEEVLQAADRAQELTAQLLAFSRRKAVQPKVMNVNEAVRRTERMLRRVLGEDIVYETDLAEDAGNIEMDPGALEQVLLNLAVNARDAMPDGGELRVETSLVHLDAKWDATLTDPIEPGDYVAICVADTGVGMDAETMKCVFEPFFTTKASGEGTGLGLSTCFGIVRQAGGHIIVESEVGVGSQFTVYLPRSLSPSEEAEASPLNKQISGSETVLVVEDDRQVRELALRALQRYGYRPIEAKSPDEAIAIIDTHDDWIDLLLTDVVMPEMNGHELAQLLTERRPELRVLYMSGYTDAAIVKRGVLEEGVHLLQKPFSPERLATAVRATLESDLETTLH